MHPYFPPPSRLVVLGLVISLLLPGISASATQMAFDAAEIDSFVTDQMDDSNIPGVAVTIVQDGQIVYSRGFGSAGNGSDVTPQTPFPIGSLTKSMTALAIMQLSEAGSIDLDAPVQQYLPWFAVADADASASITIRHLLNQTSGLSRATGIDLIVNHNDANLTDTVKSLSTAELNRPVGITYEYSNANYAVLSLVVQEVSGLPFGDYLQTHIFEPLGMTSATTDLAVAREQGLTEVHRFWFGQPVETSLDALPGHEPAFVSSEDMAAYLALYLQDGRSKNVQILSPEGIQEMLNPATNTATRPLLGNEFTFEYGMGWFAGPFGEAENARWHLGELPSFNAWMVLLPEQDQAVIVLTNAGSQMAIAGANSVMSRIPLGVVNIVSGEEPPGGMSLSTFYLGFNISVIAILALQTLALVRLIRRSVSARTSTRKRYDLIARLTRGAPLVWEVGLGAGILIAYPNMIGIGWRGMLDSIPDLTLTLLIIASLWIISAIVRITWLINTRHALQLSQTGTQVTAHSSIEPSLEKGGM